MKKKYIILIIIIIAIIIVSSYLLFSYKTKEINSSNIIGFGTTHRNDNEGYRELQSTISLSDEFQCDEVEFEYYITGDYKDISFESNIDDEGVTLIKKGNKIKLKSSKILNESDYENGLVFYSVYIINYKILFDSKDRGIITISLKNIKLKNSKKRVIYKIPDVSENIIY